MNERSIFLAALDIDDPERRAAYVAKACEGDAGLCDQVEVLLKAHRQPGAFMGRPAPALFSTAAGAAPAECPGSVVGPYKLLEQIGEGGFGVVFMAEQSKPVRRRVALKMLKPGMDSGQIVARFEAERQALALMDHPNIAKVFDAGTTEAGRLFFAMELVRGVPATDFCDQNHLPVRQRLELFVTVCQAVQHAHQKGVIHRDLKPSNVLVTLHDGVPVPKVIDFGIAKAVGQQLTERTLFTNFAQMVGTPLYMSPEQAQMSGLDVDTRADIYALGVLLYELLTGTTPFDREQFRTAGYDEIRRIIQEQEPARPSTRVSTLGPAAATVSANRMTDPAGLRRQFRGELDWIVMKCLEKDRNRRYESAAGLAADVRRYLADEPVQACPPSAWYRFRKLARRNRRALVTVSALALAAVVGVATLVVSTALVWRANRDLTDSVARERREAYLQRITVAHRELSADNLGRALELLDECPEDLRAWEWHYLKRLCRVGPLVIPDRREFNSVAFSPDGAFLATASGDGAVKVWDSQTGQVIQTLGAAHGGGLVSTVTFHPNGRHLASVGADRFVRVWDWRTREQVFDARCDGVHMIGAGYTAAFSPDGRLLAAGLNGAVRVWDWEGRRVEHTFDGHERRPISVAFSRDGRRLASGSWQGSVKLWDLAAGGGPLRTFDELHHPVTALSFSPDGDRLATASFERRVDVWDTATGGLVRTFPHAALVMGVALSPDGRLLASAGEDKTVRVWDAATGREVLGLRGHTGVCGCVAFSPDGRRLASASMDGTIRIWDATPLAGDEGQETRTFTNHRDEVGNLAVHRDGRQVVSGGFGTPAQVWDLDTGAVTAEFPGHREVVFAVAWHPDRPWVASAGRDGQLFTVKVWDARTGEEVYPSLPAGPEYFTVAFSPDGQHLVTGQANGDVRVWDAPSGRPVGLLDHHDRVIRAVVFSPDGHHLASASADGVVKLWAWDATRVDKKSGPRHRLQARIHGQCLNVAFSPDSRLLATGGAENTVKIWDVGTGRERHTLRGHSGDVYTVAWHPGGRWVASAGEDSSVKVWDGDAGTFVRSFRGHTGLVSSVAFDPNGKWMISGSRDRMVKVWDVTQLGDGPGR